MKKTQKQIAEQTGIHKSTLSLIENGHFSGSLDILQRYLDAVGLTLDVTPKKHRLPQWDAICGGRLMSTKTSSYSAFYVVSFVPQESLTIN
jgi:transcriptional regulator with XRE-family HTH domain